MIHRHARACPKSCGHKVRNGALSVLGVEAEKQAVALLPRALRRGPAALYSATLAGGADSVILLHHFAEVPVPEALRVNHSAAQHPVVPESFHDVGRVVLLPP